MPPEGHVSGRGGIRLEKQSLFEKDNAMSGALAVASDSPGFESHDTRVTLSGKWDLFTPQISMHLEATRVQGHGDISKMPSTQPDASYILRKCRWFMQVSPAQGCLVQRDSNRACIK